MERDLPKRVVNSMLGLYSWIDSASQHYGEEEAQRIRTAASEVEQLLFKHVVPATDEDDESQP